MVQVVVLLVEAVVVVEEEGCSNSASFLQTMAERTLDIPGTSALCHALGNGSIFQFESRAPHTPISTLPSSHSPGRLH